MPANGLTRLRSQWLARSERERRALSVAGLVVLAAVLYGAVYEPLRQSIAKQEKRLPMQRAETRLLKVQVSEIERLRVKAQDLPAGTSLAKRVEVLLAELGLKDSVERSDSTQSSQLSLTLKPLALDTWLSLLEGLDRRGIEVVSCQLARDDKSGALKPELLILRAR